MIHHQLPIFTSPRSIRFRKQITFRLNFDEIYDRSTFRAAESFCGRGGNSLIHFDFECKHGCALIICANSTNQNAEGGIFGLVIYFVHEALRFSDVEQLNLLNKVQSAQLSTLNSEASCKHRKCLYPPQHVLPTMFFADILIINIVKSPARF